MMNGDTSSKKAEHTKRNQNVLDALNLATLSNAGNASEKQLLYPLQLPVDWFSVLTLLLHRTSPEPLHYRLSQAELEDARKHPKHLLLAELLQSERGAKCQYANPLDGHTFTEWVQLFHVTGKALGKERLRDVLEKLNAFSSETESAGPGSATPPETEILSAAKEAIRESGLAQPAAEPEVDFDRLIRAISEIKPKRRDAVIGFILALIAGIIAELFGVYVQNTYYGKGVSEPPPVKQPEQRQNCRVVTEDALPVYRSQRRGSEILVRLIAGETVVIKNKNRNWCQIECKNNNGEKITGWTFTRYLWRDNSR